MRDRDDAVGGAEGFFEPAGEAVDADGADLDRDGVVTGVGLVGGGDGKNEAGDRATGRGGAEEGEVDQRAGEEAEQFGLLEPGVDHMPAGQ